MLTKNHDVGFHRGCAPGGVTPPHRESSAGVRSCGLYVGPPRGHAGGSRWQVPLGDRICCDCRAFQSRRTCGACPPDLPLAGLGLPHDVSDLVGCTEDPADTLDTIDNQSDAGKRLSVKLQSLAASRSHDMKIYTISGLVAAGLRPQQGL